MPDLTKIVCLKEDCNHGGESRNSGSTDTYSKSEIDAKDDAIKSIAESAKSTADAAQTKNAEQDSKIKELQNDSHTHENKDVLDKIEAPYTTAEKDKLAGLENYTAGTGLSLSGTTINHKNSVTAKTTAGFLKFKYDAQGHITGSSPVTKSDFFDYGIPYVTVGYDGECAYYFDYDEYGIPVKKIPDLTKNVDLKNIVQSFTVDESYFATQKIGGRYKFIYKLPKDYLDNGFTLKFVICGTFEKESMILELTESCGVFTTKISTFSADRDPYTWDDDPVFKVMYKISPDTINSDGERYLYLNISRLYRTYILSYQSIVGVCEFVNLDKDTLNYDESDMHESRMELLDRYYNATQSNPGLMSAKDKTKLDNIADNANNYAHPTTSGNKHIPSGGSSGQILRWSADGTAVWGDDKDTKYSNATQSASGLMTAEDKTKLDGIAIGANKTVVDTALSSTSTNPVQNKVVKAALDGKAASSHTHSYLPLSGGTMTGNATVSKSSGDAGWYAERSDTGVAVWCGVGSGGANHGVYSKKLNKWMMYGDANNVYLNGNASTATKLATARTMTIGSTGKSFDGSANVSWTLDEIGAAAASHTHTYLSNLNKSFTGSNNAAKWIKLGTLVSSGDACYTIIRVFSGNGYNSNANQNASFEIHIKDGWQSTGSATNSCGVTVYRINCSSIKVQVRASSATTYDVWCYLPWAYWNGNYSVYGRYNTWTHAGTNQSEEPTSGTAQSLSYYDYVFGNDSRLHTHSTKSTNYGTLTASSNQLSLTSAVGMNTSGKTYTHNNTSYTGSAKSEVFNDYTNNMAAGDYAHVEGSDNKGLANCTHVEGWKNVASGYQAHAEGQYCKATGEAAHAQNTSTTASGDYSHAEGWLSQASGIESHAGGYDSKANGQGSFVHGFQCTATTPWSVSMGSQCTSANSNCAFTFGWGLTNLIGNSTIVGQWNSQTKEGYFVVGKGTISAKANAFRVASDGKTYATGAYSSTGADYAEMFEWMDGNPDEEDRRGRFVTLDGEKIKFAESADDDIIGVVSAAASIIGDAYEDNWNGMYLTDIFGGNLYDDTIIDEDGNKHVYQTLNPDYDPDAIYVPRSERPEWDAVGMMGKLVVVDDGTCKVNEYCIPTTGGIATASSGRIGYRVLARIDDTHVKILMR